MLYGAHGSTDRLNTSIKPNSAIHSLHDLSGCIKHGHAHALKQSYSDSHLPSQASSPAPRVGVCFVCSGRGRLGVRKPHQWAGLGIPILVGDECDASAVLRVVCFKSGYDRLSSNLQGPALGRIDGRMTVFWSNGRHGCTRHLRQNISAASTVYSCIFATT